ncbi:uncharacterized protein LOC133328084, partial [Musca vetustissima]|uniref:uncharacterized protein LOC133328084 n=1 Tax=Musca vetustissima TaxID=27455 RepID=UPI002AB604F2
SPALFLFKSIQCKVIDPTFGRFDLCQVRMENKTASWISVQAHLEKLPLTNARMTLSTGFDKTKSMPLFNNTWDVCNFLKNRKRNRAFGRVFDFIAPYTNLNHSCPYNHGIYVNNFTFYGTKRLMPLPKGGYYVHTSYTVDGKPRMSVDITFELYD